MRRQILGGRFAAPSVLLALASGCAAAGGPSPLDLAPVPQAEAAPRLQLLPAERAYIADTASVIYRRRPSERTRDFIFADERGFGLCLRSPVQGGYDHTLLILQRRIAEDFIPQAADDVVVLRATADVTACKRPLAGDNTWVKVR